MLGLLLLPALRMPKICKLAIGSVKTASGNSPAAAAAATHQQQPQQQQQHLRQQQLPPCNMQHLCVCALAIRMPTPPIEASEINYKIV